MYRMLDTVQTIATLKTLANRIEERFPDSGLLKVCRELCAMAAETQGRIQWMSHAHSGIRFGIATLVLLVCAMGWMMIHYVTANKTTFDVTEFVPMLEAGLNALVLLGAALFFLFTLESRIKRARALKSLHELRSIAHVIDMHQLTKDPSQLLASASQRTASSPQRNMTAFQLTRYLDYCSEMLSLIGKLASLYAQSTPDGVILQAVNDIETLTNGLSRNVWQKIMILDDDVLRDHTSVRQQAATALTAATAADSITISGTNTEQTSSPQRSPGGEHPPHPLSTSHSSRISHPPQDAD